MKNNQLNEQNYAQKFSQLFVMCYSVKRNFKNGNEIIKEMNANFYADLWISTMAVKE